DDTDAYLPYIKYFLKSPATWATAERLSTGTSSTSRNRLSIDDFLEIEIPKKPVDEQKLFVQDCEAVERALSKIRGAEEMDSELLSLLITRFAQSEADKGGSPRPM